MNRTLSHVISGFIFYGSILHSKNQTKQRALLCK